MKKIIEEKEIEYIVNKSKFIGFVYNVYSIDDVKNILTSLKNKYSDATHICYAYIINQVKKYDDNQEPTAGLPILNVLENNTLNYVMCVVVRYFGGIKLGVGGLSGAYAKACKLCLENNTKILSYGFKIIIKFEYSQINQMDFLLKNSKVVDKKFDEDVTYTILITQKEFETIKNNLNVIEKTSVIM